MRVKSDTEYIAKTGHTIDIEGNIPLELKQELVRCKDCKWSDCKILQSAGINNYDGIIWCYFHGADFKYDFFCAAGERKTDGGGIKL